MKKFIFLLFVGIILFACSNDEKELIPVQEGLVFEIAAKTQPNDTKAGSPVYSQDTAQSVTRVSILAFKDDGTEYYYTKTYDITDWTAGTTFKQFVVPQADSLPEGNYSFLAIARDATDLYTLSALSSTTTIDDVTASIAASGDEYEIFAGATQAQVYSEGTRVSLTMARKVAGVLGYFKNVPQLLNGKTVRYLRLTADAGNRELSLNTELGATRSAGYDIFNIDLSTQTVINEIYTGNDLSAEGVDKLPDSQLSGAYMIPITGITLTLGLYDETNVAIKTWAVSMNAATTFDILANHFYSLGTKHKPDTTTGTNPTDPADDDNAIDLLQDQVITITLDPAWNTIHSLDIQ